MLSSDSFYKKLREISRLKKFCIAFSGGLDSTVLLYLFSELRRLESDICLRAIHIHHGLSSHADEWAQTCTKVSTLYSIPLTVWRIDLQKRVKQSLEEFARKERYNVFKELLEEEEALVTAHHQDDQAETLLLQLFRGAGPQGLASMPVYTTFGKGFLLRPLLRVSREEIHQFARKAQLTWLEDESNQNPAFDRNYLRNEVYPLIQSRWPMVTRNLARAAKHCAEAMHYIEEEIALAFDEVNFQQQGCLSIPPLLKNTLEKQNHIIRYWLKQLNLSLPSTKKLALLRKEILESRIDAVPQLRWKGVEVRRYNALLYAKRSFPAHNPKLIISWDLQEDILLPHELGAIRLSDLRNLGLSLNSLKRVTIRFRQGGETCRLKNRHHTHSLKKLFQEWRIPPWERDKIPLLYSEDELKAIIGYAVCD
jgi:tRNA(Ile)-lysidine synthase